MQKSCKVKKALKEKKTVRYETNQLTFSVLNSRLGYTEHHGEFHTVHQETLSVIQCRMCHYTLQYHFTVQYYSIAVNTLQ